VEVGRGEVKRAIPMLRQAYDTAQSAEMALWARPAAAVLGRALALAGSVADGRRHLEFAVKGGENNVAVAEWQTYLAEACLLEGDLGTAEGVIDHAIELAEKRKERGFLAHARRVAAEVACRRGDVDAARQHYDAAIALASALHMSPLLGHCELGLAAVCLGLRDAAGADRHAAAASALFADLRIPPPRNDSTPIVGRS